MAHKGYPGAINNPPPPAYTVYPNVSKFLQLSIALDRRAINRLAPVSSDQICFLIIRG